MEICRGVIWKHFESGLTQGHQKVFVCKCVFVRVCISAFVCVSCVCSTLSPGTSAMPPLSQFLTFVLKKHVDSDKTSPLSSAPQIPHGDGLEETCVHHPQPGCLIFHFTSLLFFLFQTLFYYSKSSLSPTDFHRRWRGKLSIGTSWSLPVSSVFLYCTANVGSLE